MKTIMAVLGSVMLLAAFAHIALAQDQVTITTYYPSPFGVYSDLRANRMAVGNSRDLRKRRHSHMGRKHILRDFV